MNKVRQEFGVGEWLMRGGGKAVVTGVNGKQPFPLGGYCIGITGERVWRQDGCYLDNGASSFLDLIEPWMDRAPASGLPLKGGVDNQIAESVGMADGRPMVSAPQAEPERDLLAHSMMFDLLPESVAFIFKLVIAHDGSLGEALSRAIVARGEAIGMAALLAGGEKR